jgi:hypothetical protein
MIAAGLLALLLFSPAVTAVEALGIRVERRLSSVESAVQRIAVSQHVDLAINVSRELDQARSATPGKIHEYLKEESS